MLDDGIFFQLNWMQMSFIVMKVNAKASKVVVFWNIQYEQCKINDILPSEHFWAEVFRISNKFYSYLCFVLGVLLYIIQDMFLSLAPVQSANTEGTCNATSQDIPARLLVEPVGVCTATRSDMLVKVDQKRSDWEGLQMTETTCGS